MGITLFGTTDALELVTSQAGAIHSYAKWVDATMADPPVVKGSTSGSDKRVISTAATTAIVAAPGSSVMRDIEPILVRNASATVTNDVTLQIDFSGTNIELDKVTLLPGEEAEYIDGLGFFKREVDQVVPTGTVFATAAQGPGFAADTYLTGSAIPLAGLGTPRIGRAFHWRFIVSKTAAGTAAPVLILRVGTAGSTSDAARLTFTWGAGTAAIDRGEIEIDAAFTVVGGSAVLKGKANWTTNLTTTGLSNAVKALQVTSGTFDATIANSLVGLSYNGGTSAAHTIEYLSGYTDNF